MKQLKFYGIGGQGVVTAAKILSVAVSLHEEKYAITVPAYGHERRGAPVYTDIIIDEQPILMNCFVYEPDIVIILDETIIEKGVDVGAGTKPDTVFILNTGSEEKARFFREKYGVKKLFYVDATTVAMETIGRGIPNGSILGCLAGSGAVSIESIETALKEYFGEKAGAKNANAARKAYEATREV